jgi:hypothetical protein
MRNFTIERLGANENRFSSFAKAALLSLSAFLLVACGGDNSEDKKEEKTLTQLSKEAYIYALPAVEHNKLLQSLIKQGAVSSAALSNLFSSATLSNADSTSVVSPNIDTYYSVGVLDVKYEPVVITIPALITPDRYYSIQLLDIFTNAWYISSSANDAAGKYLVAGTDWNGTVPDDIVKVIRVPAIEILALGRVQVFEPTDNAAKNIAQGFGLKTLSGASVPVAERIRPQWIEWLNSSSLPDPYDSKTGNTEDFFNVFNHIVNYQLLSGTDREVLKEFEVLNVGQNRTFSKTDFTDEEWEQIEEGVLQAKLSITSFGSSLTNGWSISPQNAARWGEDYLTRARAAWGGIYANTPEESLYLQARVDADNQTLNGQNNYTITFSSSDIPSAKFFWSVTLYKLNNFLFDNSIDRYGIRSFDSIDKESDGSFTLYIQNENPGADKENNWIPAPTEDFRLTFRVYGANDNKPVLPPLVKID